MRFGKTRVLWRVVACVLAATLLVTPDAVAQTSTTSPYPGEPTTVPGGPTTADLDLGLQEVGAILNVSVCNFAPGTVITLIVNGTAISPTVVANAQGCTIVRIEVLPNLVALGASPLHPFAATGLAATATKVQIKVNGQTLTVGPYGSVVTAQAIGTGTNGFERTVTFRFTVVKRGTISRSGVVRTGAMIARWGVGGAGLLGIGYLLVLATRRRRGETSV